RTGADTAGDHRASHSATPGDHRTRRAPGAARTHLRLLKSRNGDSTGCPTRPSFAAILLVKSIGEQFLGVVLAFSGKKFVNHRVGGPQLRGGIMKLVGQEEGPTLRGC